MLFTSGTRVRATSVHGFLSGDEPVSSRSRTSRRQDPLRTIQNKLHGSDQLRRVVNRAYQKSGGPARTRTGNQQIMSLTL
jgi:hypothetical protein